MKNIFSTLLCFALCFVLMVSPTFAETIERPALPEPFYNNSHYLFYKQVTGSGNINHMLHVYSNSEPFNLTVTKNNSKNSLAVTPSLSVTKEVYVLRNNLWDAISSTSLSSTESFTFDTIYESTVDIFSQDGTLFFQGTPLETANPVEAMTQEEMRKFLATLVGTMKTLALCGVGLIALLMVLPLFGRVFRIFQVK